MLGQRLDVVRPDEPLTILFFRHLGLHVLRVVLSRQVHRVAGRDVVVDQSLLALDRAEFLDWVVRLALVVLEHGFYVLVFFFTLRHKFDCFIVFL